MSSPTSEHGRAGRRRAASSILVALIVFGPDVALGEDRSATQTATITVSAAPRTVSVTGDASITVPENVTIAFAGDGFPGNATVGNIDTSTTLSFSNPVGNDAAKVTVARTNTNLRDIQLTLRLDPAGASGYSFPVGGPGWATTQGAARTLVQNITAGTSVEPLTLAWRVHTLSTGTETARSIVSTATFTIMDN